MRIIAAVLWGIAIGLCIANYALSGPAVIIVKAQKSAIVERQAPVTGPCQESLDYL